jgi:hypothetical protein
MGGRGRGRERANHPTVASHGRGGEGAEQAAVTEHDRSEGRGGGGPLVVPGGLVCRASEDWRPPPAPCRPNAGATESACTCGRPGEPFSARCALVGVAVVQRVAEGDLEE